jgi:hypothetical protein
MPNSGRSSIMRTSAAAVQPMVFTPDGESVTVPTTEKRVAVFGAAAEELHRPLAVGGGQMA